MSTISKKLKKLYRLPVPNDITFEEIESIMKHFGCIVDGGGNHMKIIHRESGTVIPIPRHGKTVGEAYIRQIKTLLDLIREDK